MSEELKGQIDSLRQEYEQLLNEVAMSDVSQELSDAATKIAGLPGQIKQIRSDGYAYAGYLENKAETLNQQWESIRQQIQQAIQTELTNARHDVEQLDDLWDDLEAAVSGESAANKPPKASSGLSSMLKAAMEQQQSSGVGGALNALGQSKGAASTKTGNIAAAVNRLGTATMSNETQVKALIDQLDSTMDRVKTSISSAKQRIKALYGQVPSNVSQTISQIGEINLYLERTKNATFEFNADEDIYMVVKVEWKQTGKGKDDPDGLLYISNQRLLMEQAEKKGGFMGFGGKKVEGLLWEAPIGSIQDVSFEKKGLLGGIDLIHIKFASGGPFGDTTIEVKEGHHAKVFASKLMQVVRGEIENERGLERNQAIIDAIAEAPTTCPVCGATFTQQIVRGMTQLQCEYCGSVVRLSSS